MFDLEAWSKENNIDKVERVEQEYITTIRVKRGNVTAITPIFNSFLLDGKHGEHLLKQALERCLLELNKE